MIEFYVERIHDSKTTLDKVTPKLRDQVLALYLEKYGIDLNS